jgi:transposase InsO family protein
MGRVATSFDNTIAGSFFATLKTELVHTRTWPTRQAARTAIYGYIEVFYNRRRRHSAWTICPAEYEGDATSSSQLSSLPHSHPASTEPDQPQRWT